MDPRLQIHLTKGQGHWAITDRRATEELQSDHYSINNELMRQQERVNTEISQRDNCQDDLRRISTPPDTTANFKC